MTSLPLRRRALATLCASLLVVASATTAPLFVTAPARAHGPKLNGAQPDRRPFRVGRPVSYKNLSLFPVHGRVAPPPTNDYVTLDEGLRAGTVVITERGGERRMVRRRGGRRGARRVQVRSEESGDDSVNELALINRSGKKLLLLGGEVIVGGKQDRIVEEDLIVPAVSVPVSLSVFCVEHGRWSHRSERAGGVGGVGGGGVGVGSGPVQAASETVEVVASPSVVEANVSASQSTSNEMSVSGSRSASASRPETFSSLGAISHPKLRAAAQDKKEQGEVWKEVSANNVRLNTTNTTDTYQQVYESEEVRATMDDYVAALQGELAGADVVGVVVARGGELIWVDQFASPSLFRRYWPKLLKSYVVEAISGPTEERKPGVEEAQRYLDERSGDAKATVKPGVYELTKLENPRYAVFDLWDISKAARVRLHYNKMQR